MAVASEREAPWVLLPLITCESICGNYEEAIPLCASLQFFMAAGDVFDDIEDNDSPLSLSSRYGTAITNNIATTLLVLGEKAISRLKDRNVDDRTIVRILDAINSYYLIACTGQHKDLSCGKKIDISEDDYLDILSLKSASQIECASYTGALLATENKDLLDIFKEFGYSLGMMAQITNDIAGIISKKDLVNKKITLPVIFALSQSEEPVRNQLERYYRNKSDDEITIEQISYILSNSGAVHYTAIKMESYRLLASGAVDKAENCGIDTEKLRIFLR
ncbi:MAG: polyprenyl synthetase family protein [Dehalococcoidales bacterium]|nr:polyprenyl synthetase family protein [Dehalococcoidales bacterium]